MFTSKVDIFVCNTATCKCVVIPTSLECTCHVCMERTTYTAL